MLCVIIAGKDIRMSRQYLAHHGILGMKWGVRRYQNADGSLNPKGQEKISKKYKSYMDTVKARIENENANANRTRRAKADAGLKEVSYRGSQSDNDFHSSYNKLLLKDIKQDKYYKKAQQLVKDCNASSLDVVKQNNKRMNSLKEDSKRTTKLTLDDRFNEAKKVDPNLTFNKIYKSNEGKKVTEKWRKSFGNDDFKEDSAYYQDMEEAYYDSKGILRERKK